MRRTRPQQLLVSIALAAVISCGGRPSPDAEPDPQTDSRSDAMVRVDNRGFSDMTIYIVSGSQRGRLGVVSGNSVASFTIRHQYTTGGPVRFLADPIGSSRTPVSEELVVNPGDVVTLMIPPN